jgi:hypothetical protein
MLDHFSASSCPGGDSLTVGGMHFKCVSWR